MASLDEKAGILYVTHEEFNALIAKAEPSRGYYPEPVIHGVRVVIDAEKAQGALYGESCRFDGTPATKACFDWSACGCQLITSQEFEEIIRRNNAT